MDPEHDDSSLGASGRPSSPPPAPEMMWSVSLMKHSHLIIPSAFGILAVIIAAAAAIALGHFLVGLYLVLLFLAIGALIFFVLLWPSSEKKEDISTEKKERVSSEKKTEEKKTETLHIRRPRALRTILILIVVYILIRWVGAFVIQSPALQHRLGLTEPLCHPASCDAANTQTFNYNNNDPPYIKAPARHDGHWDHYVLFTKEQAPRWATYCTRKKGKVRILCNGESQIRSDRPAYYTYLNENNSQTGRSDLYGCHLPGESTEDFFLQGETGSQEEAYIMFTPGVCPKDPE